MPTRNHLWNASIAAIAAAGMATGAVAAGSMSGGELGATTPGAGTTQTGADIRAEQRYDADQSPGSMTGGELGATAPGAGTAQTGAADRAQQPYDANRSSGSMTGGDLGATAPGAGTVQTGAATQSRMDGAEQELNRVQEANGIRYVCTGVGDQQQNAARWSDWPAKLVFAADSGDYLSDVEVTIRDKQSGDVVFNAGCRYGPWMLVDLEPGQYTVTTEALDRDAETTTLDVGHGRQAQRTVIFDQISQT